MEIFSSLFTLSGSTGTVAMTESPPQQQISRSRRQSCPGRLDARGFPVILSNSSRVLTIDSSTGYPHPQPLQILTLHKNVSAPASIVEGGKAFLSTIVSVSGPVTKAWLTAQRLEGIEQLDLYAMESPSPNDGVWTRDDVDDSERVLPRPIEPQVSTQNIEPLIQCVDMLGTGLSDSQHLLAMGHPHAAAEVLASSCVRALSYVPEEIRQCYEDVTLLMSALTRCTDIRSLVLPRVMKLGGESENVKMITEALGGLQKLRALYIPEASAFGRESLIFSQCSALTALEWGGGQIDMNAMAALSKLTHLQVLDLHAPVWVDNAAHCLEILAKSLPKVQSWGLVGWPVGDVLPVLSKHCSSLTELRLGGKTQWFLRKTHAAALQSLTQLGMLTLSDVRFQPGALAALKNVRALTLSKPQSLAWSELAELSMLETLIVPNDTGFGLDEVGSFLRVCTNNKIKLRFLQLPWHQLRQEDKRKLRVALPACTFLDASGDERVLNRRALLV